MLDKLKTFGSITGYWTGGPIALHTGTLRFKTKESRRVSDYGKIFSVGAETDRSGIDVASFWQEGFSDGLI